MRKSGKNHLAAEVYNTSGFLRMKVHIVQLILRPRRMTSNHDLKVHRYEWHQYFNPVKFPFLFKGLI